MSKFDWNDARYFLALARGGDANRAAQQIGADHTTVRRRIAALERDLKTKLIDRRDRHLVLTAEGEQFLNAAEAAEGLLLGVEQTLSGQVQSLAGLIRVGAPHGIASYFLASRLAKFQRRHPKLQIELVATATQFNLTKREADIALMTQRPSQAKQIVRKVTDCRVYFCATEDYLRNAPPLNKVADLQHHTFVGFIEHFGLLRGLEKSFPAYDRVKNPTFCSNSLIAQFQAALAGGGICVLPRYMLAHAPQMKIIFPDKLFATRELFLVTHPDLKRIARFRAVMEFILAEIAKSNHLFT